MVKNRRASGASDSCEQLDLDLLNLEQPIVLTPHEVIDFLLEMPNLELGFQVDLVIVFRAQAITCFPPILAHQDDRHLDRREARQDQVHENV